MNNGKTSPRYIDTHVHIWSGDLQRYPLGKGWGPSDMKPPVYLPDDILHDARPSGVDRVVLLQMNFYGFDNSFMLDAIRKRPTIFRGIAVVNRKTDTPETEMSRLAESGVRAFRLYPEEVTPSKLSGSLFERMFRFAGEQDLAISLLMNPESLEAVDRQCKKFPDTSIVVEHMARIGMNGSIRDDDIAALCALAKHAKVLVKLSGFYALGQAKPPHLDLEPLIKRIYEAFGAKRLIWGSDCPFQVVHETYEDGISVIRDRLRFLSAEDKEWILGRTAEELFFS
jgi:predicted TIM-barrel fold metal-dependent hydrolase